MPKDELFKIDNFMKSYINEKKVLHLSNNTLIAYSSVLNSFYEYYTRFYDTISVESIDRVFIVNFLESISISVNSKNLYIVVLKNFFKYLQTHFYPNVDFKNRFIELRAKAQKKDPVSLTQSEYEKVMGVFEKERKKRKRSFYSYRNTLLLKIFLLSGARVSELLGIEVSNITVLKIEESRSVYKVLILGKGNKQRYVYIACQQIEEELEYIKSYMKEQNLSTEHFAITKEGRVLGRAEVYKMVESFLKAQGINKRGVHMLRHSFGKHLVHQNVNLSTIKALMGHENIQTTMIYASSDEESMIRAVL